MKEPDLMTEESASVSVLVPIEPDASVAPKPKSTFERLPKNESHRSWLNRLERKYGGRQRGSKPR